MRALIATFSSLLCALVLPVPCAAQAPPPPTSPATALDKASAAVALVLASQAPGETAASTGAALVVYQNGDLLTSWHLLRNAHAVQVRFKSGEVFDRVKLLAVDERRDVAAIRISATGLPVLPIAPAAEAAPGDPVLSLFHPQAMPWSSSTGVVSAYRLADEVPGAGTGFRVLQFTAPASPGASGGVLVDAKGRALGLATGALNGGQTLNLAVPIENVLGLADTPPVKTFANGAQLVPVNQAAPPAPAPPPEPPLTATIVQPPHSEKPESSAASTSREALLQSFKTMFVDAGQAKYFGSDRIKAALAGNKDFAALNIRIVDDPKVADTILVVGYSPVWDFPFELKHQATSTVLLAGIGFGPFSGPVGALDVAGKFVKAVKPYRSTPPR
jgi:hypothetical protein